MTPDIAEATNLACHEPCRDTAVTVHLGRPDHSAFKACMTDQLVRLQRHTGPLHVVTGGFTFAVMGEPR